VAEELRGYPRDRFSPVVSLAASLLLRLSRQMQSKADDGMGSELLRCGVG